MTTPSESLPPSYFEQLYQEQADPWSFATSPYEAAKYSATLAALPRARYHAAFEIGCSIGVLTQMLATRCDALLAVDVSDTALERARARCGRLSRVQLARLRFPCERPQGPFDLILVSEVGYYWSRAELAVARAALCELLEPGGHLLLVHWTPFVQDYPLTGDEVHEAFLDQSEDQDKVLRDGLRWLAGSRADCYRLDLFERV